MRERNHGINIRVSEKEKQRIVRNARKCKLSVSEYLRQLANGYSPREMPDEMLYQIFDALLTLQGTLAEELHHVQVEDILQQLYPFCYPED